MTTNNYAFPLTAIDREILAMKDEDFALVTWEELKDIIGNFPTPLTMSLLYLLIHISRQSSGKVEASPF